jgi:hypothetical protein
MSGRVVGAVVLGLVLVGAGVGIGALAWSSESSTRTVTVSPAANEAADNADGGDDANPPPRNYTAHMTAHVVGVPEGTPFKLALTTPTHCTDQSTAGQWDKVTDGDSPVAFTTVAMFETEDNCRFDQEVHENTWQVDVTAGRGQFYVRVKRVTMSGGAKVMVQRGACRGWTGPWTCNVREPQDGQSSDFVLTRR